MVIQSRMLHRLVNLRKVKEFLTSNRAFVRMYFEAIYVRGDPYQTQDNDAYFSSRREAFGLLEGFRASEALDIGCGEGHQTIKLAPYADHVLGVDISELAIKRARRAYRHDAKLDFRQADFMMTDLDGRTFDLVVAGGVFLYMNKEQLDDAVTKTTDLLKARGKLLLIHPRALADDVSGLQLKEYGARTVHDRFASSPDLLVEKDILQDLYRITLLQHA